MTDADAHRGDDPGRQRHRGRALRRVLLALALLLVVALVGAYWWQRPLLLTATGYAAHNACAVTEISGRDDPEADLPPNPLVPLLRTDQDGAVTRATLLGILAGQRAEHTDGFGCAVGEDVVAPPPATPVSAEANPLSGVPEPEEVDPDVEEALADAFGDDLSAPERDDLGTRAVVVLRDGALVAERYAEGFGPDVPQLGWSMAKSATNLLVGRLARQGVVSLDDADLRAEWADDDRSDITVAQLLQMTSGLAWDETYSLGTPITRMLYLEPDMGDYVATQELAHEPGTHLQYSSGSTTLLCDILTDLTGDGADLPRHELFAPLGLSSAVLEPDASGTPVCSSYLWATPRDWATIGQFALQDGVWDGEQLLPEGWMAWSTAPVDVESEEEGYAASWWVNRRPDGSLVHPELPRDTFFATGHDGQRLFVVPSAGLVVARLGFTPVREETGVVDLVAALIDAP